MSEARINFTWCCCDGALIVYPHVVFSGEAKLLKVEPLFILEFGVLFGKWGFWGSGGI